jgi:ABC-type transport system involved in multi-copper enzyme maturation permease subunit
VARDAYDAVRFIQSLLALGVADAGGLLLILIWTAGFLPTFLEPGSASIMLAKPVPRWSLLLGKYLGVLTFVGVNAVLFVAGTWLALGVGTGVWDPTYFWVIPMLLIHFAVFFSFSTLLAVATRSTVACVFGSVLFWTLCWGMNYARHAVVATSDLNAMAGSFSWALEAGYWVLPKPADMGILLVDALKAGNFFVPVLEYHKMQEMGAFHPELSVLSSMAFAAMLLGLSAYEFVTTDY